MATLRHAGLGDMQREEIAAYLSTIWLRATPDSPSTQAEKRIVGVAAQALVDADLSLGLLRMTGQAGGWAALDKVFTRTLESVSEVSEGKRLQLLHSFVREPSF